MSEYDQVRCPDYLKDPTPAQAIRNEEKSPEVGEIWSKEGYNAPFLVVTVGRGFVTSLFLSEVQNMSSVQVPFDGHAYYTNPTMLTYVLDRQLGEKLGCCDRQVLGAIQEKIAEHFGYAVDDAHWEEVNSLEKQITRLNGVNKLLLDQNETLKKELDAYLAPTGRPENVINHAELCCRLTDLYERKNHDYGDSFAKTWEEYGPMMLAIRLDDKLGRFKKLLKADAKVADEGIHDTLMDLANYAIMGLLEIEKE